MKEKERKIIIEEIKRELKKVEDGNVSVSPYDTAFLARLDSPDKEPLFPECLDWLLGNQYPDGSWGSPDIEYNFERIICTLAAIYAIQKWHPEHKSIAKGVDYLNVAFTRLDFKVYATVGFELAFPTLYRLLVKSGLNLNADMDLITYIEAKVRRKLSQISLYGQRSTLLHSLEHLIGKDVDFTELMKYQEANGSFGCSPASTAFVYEHTGDKKAYEYLRKIVKLGNGTVPALTPIDIFGRNWIVNSFIDLNLVEDFKDELEPLVDHLDQSWTPQGMGLSKFFSIPDIDDSVVGYRILKVFGREKDIKFIRSFESPQGFYCYKGELDTAPTHNANLIVTLKEAKDFTGRTELIKKAIRTFNHSLKDTLVDKWHVSPYYTYSRLASLARYSELSALKHRLESLIIKNQNSDGGWGYWGKTTSEETAYAVIALIKLNPGKTYIVERMLLDAYKCLTKNDNIPRLWIGKSLYSSDITKFAILQAKLAIINFLNTKQMTSEEQQKAIQALLEAASKRVEEFVTEQGISFKRGDVFKYFLNISKLNLGLSLPQLPKQDMLESIVLKNFFVLWNIMVDDEIDGEQKSTLLDDSYSLVISGKGETAAAKLLEQIMNQVNKNGTSAEFTKLDILNISQGFYYEKLININDNVATIAEYQQYSTITASLNILMDIDLSYVDLSTITDLSRVRGLFFHLSKAIKYASDIGSLDRETTTEKNLNLTLLKFAELKGIKDKDELFTEAQKPSEELKEAVAFVRALAQSEVANAKAMLDELGDEYGMIFMAANKVVERYSEGADIFFEKK